MEEKIEEYLRGERQVESEVVREKLRQKVMKYADIAQEFETWLAEREYRDGVEVQGYSAKKISEIAPGLSGIGVYNFLVTLRDDPEEAKKIIDEGFMVK